MKAEQHMVSIFDRYHKLDDPSAQFEWIPTPPSIHLSKSDIVCDGHLFEVEQSSSMVHSPRYFAATTKYLLSYSVFLYQKYIFLGC